MRGYGEMATESNPNPIADFDIDEVIDWDKHDIPSKDIEFDPLQSLNLAANVASTSQKSTTTSAGRGGLVLTNQLLASQPPAGAVHHGETGAAIVGMPQVSQTSAINPVFPGDTSSLIADIRQEYLHAQNSAARSRTPPTPTFPSENFDLPPITPPGSLQAQSSYSVGQQPLRMALVSNLNRPAAVPQSLQTFVQPNLSQLGPIVGEPMEEGSNIENLLDEIVERNMPQGVSEPIVFTPQVSQQPNPSTARMQMSSQPMQKGIPSVPVRAGSPAHLSVAQTNASGKTSLSIGAVQTGSPLNTVTSSASPLTPSRSPSPTIKQTMHTGKVSVPLRPGNQPLRLSSPSIQPGSPLQSMGSPTPQLPVKATRTVVAQGNQIVSTSQILQMAVPSAIVSSSPSVKTQVSSNSLQIKQSGGMPNINSQVSVVPLSTSTVQANISSMVPHRPVVNVGSRKATVCTANNSQGSGIVPITIQSNSRGKPIQGIPLQNLTANPKLLDQLVRSAMGQSHIKQGQLGEATSGAGALQAGQPLICYVVPQNAVSGVPTLQAKGSIPLTATGQPVKMILVNANSALKSPVPSNAPSSKTVMMSPATSNLSKVSTSLPVQSFSMSREFEPISSSSAEDLGSENLISVTMSQHSATPTVVTSLAQPSLSHSRITQSDVCSPAFNASQQNPVRSSTASSTTNNSVSKLNSILVGSTSVTGESNVSAGLQKPLSSTNTPTSVVQITFVNEATAISQVVAASSCVTSTGQTGTMSTSPVMLPAENRTSASSQPGPSSLPQESDEDEDDSTPLSQVAENLKKSDDVKKKKKKKKEKGTKRKKRSRDNLEPSKPLTAYEIFFKETQAAIRLQNQSAEFEDISKIADQMWKNATESQKKVYQEKQERIQKDYYKALEEYKAKKSLQEDTPSPKHSRVDLPESAASTVAPVSTTPCTATSVPWEAVKDSALSGTKPLNHVGQSALSGKPVATVPPMATVKTPATNIHSTPPVKPKKHKVIVNPISQRICLSDGCNMPARTTKERGTQYCSNECVVKHCRAAFTSWVAQRNVKSEIS